MGLAFDIGSSNFASLVEANGPNDTSGLTFLSNIFLQNKTAPNLFTVLLGRDYDKDGPQEGAFTISEYVEGLEKISEEPKLFRTPAQVKNVTTLPRWSVQLDSMTVNGTKFQFNQSSVSEADPGKQVVVLDTGFTFSQMPPAAVDFIYSQIPGSFFNQTSGFWVVPCDATIPLSFEFAGKSFPVHPLDITTIANSNNNTVCVNSYRYVLTTPQLITFPDSLSQQCYQPATRCGCWIRFHPGRHFLEECLHVVSLTSDHLCCVNPYHSS